MVGYADDVFVLSHPERPNQNDANLLLLFAGLCRIILSSGFLGSLSGLVS